MEGDPNINAISKTLADYACRAYREAGVVQLSDGDNEVWACSGDPAAHKRACDMVAYGGDFAADILEAMTQASGIATALKNCIHAILEEATAARSCDFCHKACLTTADYTTVSCELCKTRGLDMCLGCVASQQGAIVCPPELNLTPCNKAASASELTTLSTQDGHSNDEAKEANVGGDHGEHVADGELAVA